jgi:ABC-type antimicrobial peptide transport system permease subunit
MRKLYLTFRTAIYALKRNVMRSVLTTLGIIIGVAAVIGVMAIGNGSSAAIQKTIASMGANNLMILPGAAASGGVSYGAGSVVTLSPQDADAIMRECQPAVSAVAVVVRGPRNAQVVYGNRNWIPMSIYGTTPTFLDVRDWQDLAEGDPFTDKDVVGGAKVCLVGQTIVRELFQGESPVGKEVRIQNVSFRVVGVLSRKGANMMGMDQDDIVLAPWTTIKYRVSSVNNGNTAGQAGSNAGTTPSVNTTSNIYPNTNPQTLLYPQQTTVEAADSPQSSRFTNIDQILAKADNAADIPTAINSITALLHDRHHIHAGEPDDFQIRDMTEMSNALASTSQTMKVLLIVVALISLFVGGVGIMNIMLVSVTERTREIGLRMAVGARAGDILRQFLVEAVVLCLSGGLVGILMGCGASYLVKKFLSWPTDPTLISVVIAVSIAATVGVVFGYYPAWKASRLDPIEALRYE